MSSGDIAISVRNLSKAYVIAHNAPKHTTLAEAMMHRVRSPFARAARETFWALRDLSLDIKKGEVVGVIGRNGAGKSTFLKVLSRITEPTSGKIDLFGRVGSLLEVGTGFHPELTGRENVYLNGQILGMRKREIDRQFDAIVEFAGVEKFLDTPVKRYSSGMYVRLAFAVAAHLSSEILVIDEVLAVGDMEFQKKCLGKMGDVARSGRTVLFVSHSMQAITSLCDRGIVLNDGRVLYDGATGEAVDLYMNKVLGGAAANGIDPRRRPGSGEYRFEHVVPAKVAFNPADEKTIRFRLARHGSRVGLMYFSGLLVNSAGIHVAQFDGRLAGHWLRDEDAEGEGELRFTLPWPKPGPYHVDLYLCTPGGGLIDRFDAACHFQISDVMPHAYCASPDAYAYGLVLADFAWVGPSVPMAAGELREGIE